MPGKACGSTLGDICATSEVRGRFYNQTHSHERPQVPQKMTAAVLIREIVFSLFLVAVLPVLSPIHRSVRRRRSHCDRSGKLPSGLFILSLKSISARFVSPDHESSAPLLIPKPRTITHRLFLSSHFCAVKKITNNSLKLDSRICFL